MPQSEMSTDPSNRGIRPPKSLSSRAHWLRHIEASLRDSWERGDGGQVEQFHDLLEEIIISENEYVGLIHQEILFRQRAGKVVVAAEYAERFPHLAHRLQFLLPGVGDSPNGQHTEVFKGLGANPAPRHALPPEVRIPGYEILEVLGRGGMGVVYKARQHGLNRLVALKMVLGGRHAGEDELERFWREAEAVASLSHPNIVQVYEVNQHEGNPYFSLEYIDGGTLADLLRKGPLSSRDAARLVEQLAVAMQLAHDQQIIHRDLKPANILLGRNSEAGTRNAESKTKTPRAGVGSGDLNSEFRIPNSELRKSSEFLPKITDFGVAKRLNEDRGLTATGIAAGTPQYMSPEQALADTNHPLSAASDIYSLGVILYECLTGRVPIDGDNSADVMRRVVREAPPPPSRHRTGLPRDLETICLKCLEKLPHQRYLTAADLAADLRRWQEGRPIHARPVSRAEHGYRWCRRNPVVAVLLACLFIALLTGTATALVFAVRASRYADEATHNAIMLGDEKIVADQHAREAGEQALLARENEQRAWESEQRARESELKALDSEAKARDSERRATDAFRVAATRLGETQKARQAEEAANARLRAQMYALKSNMAFGDYKIGQVMTTRTLLDQMMPQHENESDLRGFEWWYLKQLSDPAINRQSFTEEVVHLSSAGEPDTWYLGLNGSLYETRLKAAMNPYRPLTGGKFGKLAVHRDANRIAYAPHTEDFVFVADYTTREVLQKIPLPGRRRDDVLQNVTSLRFSPDGSRLAVTVASPRFVQNPGYLIVWDVAGGRELRRFAPDKHGMLDAMFSPDGRKLVFIRQTGTYWIWDARTLEQVAEGTVPDNAVSLAVNHNASLVLIGGVSGKTYVSDTATGRVLRTLFGHTGWVSPITLSADGQMLATSASDQSIRLWNIDTGEHLRTLPGHGTATTALSFSESGTTLISGSDRGEVNIWDCRRDPEALVRPESGICQEVFRLPDRRWLVADYWGRFRLLNDDGEPETPYYLPTGRHCMTMDWAVSPDGRWLVCSTNDDGDPGPKAPAVQKSSRGVWLVSLESLPGEARRLPGVPTDAHHLTFSPDGKTLASIHRDGQLRLTDVATRKEIGSFKAGGVDHNFVAFTADGRELITASGQGLTVKRWTTAGKLVWSFTDRETLPRVSPQWGGFFLAMALSPDDKSVAVATIDQEVLMLDAATGTMRTTNLTGSTPGAGMKLRGHAGQIHRLAFDTGGTRLATTSMDGTVRVWDAVNGYALLNLRGHSGPTHGVAFSADGSGLASVANRELRIWDGRQARWREDIRNISRECRMQNVRVVAGDDNTVRVTGLFVNESKKTMKAPNWEAIDDRVRAVVLLEPPVKEVVLRNTLRESDRHRINITPFILFDEILAGEAIPVSMSFRTEGWPAGKYRLWFTHSNGGLYSGKESPPVEFTLSADRKQPAPKP